MIRQDWSRAEIEDLYNLPLMDLIFRSHTLHRNYFDPNAVQISTLLSIKTGACPEDCAYCPQSIHYKTDLEREKLLPVEMVLEEAKTAKANGATRFCMTAAWRSPTTKNLTKVAELVQAVKKLDLEVCITIGMLSAEQAQELKAAGLDFYNHNLDTSPEFYSKIVTTHTYQQRLDTLKHVRDAGVKVCCGGILGMGETRDDRIGLLLQLATLPQHPESVTINQLVAIVGTPLENQPKIDPIEFIRAIAVARILMPRSFVRLSAGRKNMSEEMHAICFFAGANSIHCGKKLITTPIPGFDFDRELLKKLGITAI